MHKVDPSNGSWSHFGGDWSGPTRMAAIGKRLFVIQAGGLHSVSPKDGSYDRFPGNWANATSMTALADRLFAIQADSLHSIDPTTGRYSRFEGTWDGPTIATGWSGYLYVIQSNKLHRVDPNDGRWIWLDGNWGSDDYSLMVDNYLAVCNKSTMSDEEFHKQQLLCYTPVAGTAAALALEGVRDPRILAGIMLIEMAASKPCQDAVIESANRTHDTIVKFSDAVRRELFDRLHKEKIDRMNHDLERFETYERTA